MLDIVIAVVLVVITYVAIKYFSSNSTPAPPAPTFKKPVPKVQPVVEESEEDKKLVPMTIFYGSQSGTAEGFANEIAEQAKMYGFKARVWDLEEYEKEDLMKEKYIVFMLATFGDGEPTDNAASFYEWIMNADRDNDYSISGVPFSVFALGNRQYEHYCVIGRKVDKRLEDLNGIRVTDRGEGDDDCNIDDDFNKWKKQFWLKSQQYFNITTTTIINEQMPKFTPSFTMTKLPSLNNVVEEDDEEENQDLKAVKSYVSGVEGLVQTIDPKHRAELATVVEHRQLRQDQSDSTSTVHIELDISHSKLTYLTADNLGIYPRNSHKLTGKMISRMGYHKDDMIRIQHKNTNNQKKLHVPEVINVMDLFLWHLDFMHVPKHKELPFLIQYTTNEEEKEKLLYYYNHDQGKEEYQTEKRSTLELLIDFPSIQIPLVDFIEWCPKLQPRYYTISSSSLINPKRIAITVSLSFENLPRNRKFMGICSSYLDELKIGKDKLCVFVRASTFRLPRLPNTPVVMVGPGTGVAPFRAFIQEVTHLKNKDANRPVLHSLFFGCRHPEKDYIYQNELEEAKNNGVVSNLQVAFSRYQDKKVYVQDLMKLPENSTSIYEAIYKNNGYFFVCGATTMGRGVKEVLYEILKSNGVASDEAQKFLTQMQQEGRYVAELWD